METEITYRGVKLVVEGTYVPEEPMVMYYADMSGMPGSNSYFEVDAVFVGGVDISELLSFDDIDEIAMLVLENIKE
jgi:hypothetical protein